ncbi:MAG: M23 family metallopeptidase [Candidatus Margulisiibacteriota bacterium]|nr:M23 family metallopeptidase [Candidatus Margulisiibacteriota bacterium]
MPDRSVYIRRRVIIVIISVLLVVSAIFAVRFGAQRYQNYLKYSKIKKIGGSIKPGQVLFTSLVESGISREAANEIIGSIGDILNLQKLRAKDKYTIYTDESDKVQKFIYEKSPVELYFAVRGEDDELNSFIPSIFLKKEMSKKELIIKTSLFDAVRKQGEKDALLFSIVDIFAWDIDFYLYPRAGDKIGLYFEKYFSEDGRFVKYGKILAAQYKGRETFDAVYFEPENNLAGYYDLKGNPAEKMFLKSPLKFTGRITSYYGPRRDPITHRHGRHTGVDFASHYGAPIVATSGGIVSYAGWRGAYGKLVKVRHANGYETYYGHCSRINVRPGKKVSQGEVVALVGSTGHSTGPHCHYEIRSRGRTLNPLRFNQPKRKPLKGKDLEVFKVYEKEIWKNIGRMEVLTD